MYGDIVEERRDCGDSIIDDVVEWSKQDEKYLVMNNITHWRLYNPPKDTGE